MGALSRRLTPRVCKPRALEAAIGVPLALLREGDRVAVGYVARRMDLLGHSDALAARRGAWVPPPPKHRAGVFAKYARLVRQAPGGAVRHAGPAHWRL